MTPAPSYLPRLAAAARAPSVALIATCLLLGSIFLFDLEADPDLFARLAVGRLVTASGEVPTTDPYAFTATKPLWVDHEWLSGVVFHSVLQHGGSAGLFAFKCALCWLTLTLLLRAHRLRRDDRSVAPHWLLLMAASSAYLWISTVRAQVFTYLFLALFLLAFAEHERRGRRGLLLALPLVMAIWAQCHGGFVVGLGFLAIHAIHAIHPTHAAAAARRPGRSVLALGVLAANVASTFLSPYGGVEYWRYILDAITMNRPQIAEWAPLSMISPPAWVADLFLALIVVEVALRRRSPPAATVALALSAWFGYRHVRLIGVFVMVAFVYASDLLDGPVQRLGARAPRAFRIGTAGASLALLLSLPASLGFSLERLLNHGARLTTTTYPVAALDWLWHERDGGNLLVGFNHGSFALWRIHPRYRVSMDGRYEEVYPDATVELVARALDPRREGHEEALRTISPDFILVRVAGEAELAFGDLAGRWFEIYRDEAFALLSRDPPPNGRVAGPRPEPDDVWAQHF